MKQQVTVIGGGLAGTEAAWALARLGIDVDLYEMRPVKKTPAHQTAGLAELVCSNSLRSMSTHKAVGMLKREMRQLGSLVMQVAQETCVPAGQALAVDRLLFSEKITAQIHQCPKINIHRQEVMDLNEALERGPVIVATGPLTSSSLAEHLKGLMASETLYFYDAISPIIDSQSLDWDHVFKASRYDKGGEDDYLNCPMDEETYYHFVRHLRKGMRVVLKTFEKEIFFEGCLPIEVMADRGDLTLAHGPMKPVGLLDPRTGRQPFAVVQLRRETRDGDAYNIVGFQTKLTHPEQKRILRLIPALKEAEFFRMGSIHRNTYINSPRLLNEDLSLKNEPRLFFAGQITGTEGYVESSALGLWVGLLIGSRMQGSPCPKLPPTTALGAMLRYLTEEPRKNFQPMNINLGIFPRLAAGPKRLKKAQRGEAYSLRAETDFNTWLQETSLPAAF